jgi:hypothetical protein
MQSAVYLRRDGCLELSQDSVDLSVDGAVYGARGQLCGVSPCIQRSSFVLVDAMVGANESIRSFVVRRS